MSIVAQIPYLEELSSIDVEIKRIDEQLEQKKSNLTGMRSEVKGLEDRLRVDRETLASMEKTKAELHTELRQMTQQIERSREKLNRSRSERESNAAQRELEELRKLHRDREDDVEKLAQTSEAARLAIEETEGKRAALSGDLEGSSEGITTSIAELEANRIRAAEARKAVVAKLPPALYRKYETIRGRRPVAIAKTHDGTCLGCHVAVPPMMFQKMRRQNEFETCPHCKRLLYYVPPEPPAAQAPDPSRAS
ncbi:MAG: C4-type zinc ribbon domain-containing protein [Byssovorax sp.]